MPTRADAAQKADQDTTRVRRKHLRSCHKALAGPHYRVFKEFVALYGNGPIKPLGAWIGAWAAACRRVGTDGGAALSAPALPSSFHKVTLSNWRAAVLPAQRGSIPASGLAFYVRRIQVAGKPVEGKAWTGVMLLIYERKTHSLFHYVAAEDQQTAFPAGMLWFALAKALQALRRRHSPGAETSTVLLPRQALTTGTTAFFGEAAALWDDAMRAGTPFEAKTHAGKSVTIQPESWNLRCYAGLAEVTLTMPFEAPRDFRAFLQKLATATSVELKAQYQKAGATDALPPVWQGLNRPGTDPKWLEKLQKRRSAATPATA